MDESEVVMSIQCGSSVVCVAAELRSLSEKPLVSAKAVE